MPAVHYIVELPDGEKRQCYSPSTVIHEHFKSGDAMPMSEFIQRSRTALNAASDRVRQRFGFACSSAMDQLSEIESWGRSYPADQTVRILKL
ncbi:putative repeat protein (TIGR04042 family) [Prosthecobacter fusiformis]|uniref:Putative repeat protein (TIGR04042 family) n=1 Tax=Prosthecobacter fusiformis TaxID=48464 RepID=A0A4R7RZB5_9BACT|nr:MSMEG_0570 family nitrogen starvation response protein [Prosthecobacter fusiformis]TDU71211.1 putative repeat protein (TIGR04042 family) [Prosthecobacter fusiformis]